MQQPKLNCERDEFPPIGFWQDQEITSQRVRLLPQNQNGPAGAALFGLGFCRYNGDGKPPSQTDNAMFDQVIHGPDRDTELHTAHVTTTLSTVSIRFDNYPKQPDDGLTDNPCWPSTLVDDPGFALLVDDPWYFAISNFQRRHTATDSYAAPPPFALIQSNAPRPGYQKRQISKTQPGLITSRQDDTEQTYEEFSDDVSPTPRPRDAGLTTDTNSALTRTSGSATIGGGLRVARNPMPKATGMGQ